MLKVGGGGGGERDRSARPRWGRAYPYRSCAGETTSPPPVHGVFGARSLSTPMVLLRFMALRVESVEGGLAFLRFTLNSEVTPGLDDRTSILFPGNC